MQLWQTEPDNPRRPVAPANFLDWRRDSRSFDGLAAFTLRRRNLLGDTPEQVEVASVSAAFLGVLGVAPALGRDFGSEERPEAILTHALWQRAYGGSRDMAVPDDLQSAIDADPAARATFATLSAQNRFALAFRLHNLRTEAGRRKRIAAFVELGRTHIPARTATWGMLERELAEIDENIVRRRFSVLERGRLLARKKELYEAVHPEARQHARGVLMIAAIRGGSVKFTGEIRARCR